MIIAYIRPDGAEMVEVAPSEAVNAAYLKAEGLDAEPRRPLTEIKAEAEQAIAVSHAQAVARAEKKQTEAPPAPSPISAPHYQPVRHAHAFGRAGCRGPCHPEGGGHRLERRRRGERPWLDDASARPLGLSDLRAQSKDAPRQAGRGIAACAALATGLGQPAGRGGRAGAGLAWPGESRNGAQDVEAEDAARRVRRVGRRSATASDVARAKRWQGRV